MSPKQNKNKDNYKDYHKVLLKHILKKNFFKYLNQPGERHITFSGAHIRIIADFLAETVQNVIWWNHPLNDKDNKLSPQNSNPIKICFKSKGEKNKSKGEMNTFSEK